MFLGLEHILARTTLNAVHRYTRSIGFEARNTPALEIWNLHQGTPIIRHFSYAETKSISISLRTIDQIPIPADKWSASVEDLNVKIGCTVKANKDI